MIIFNNKEMGSKYTLSDDMILEINSPLSLDVIYEKLAKGEEISPEEVSIHAYKNGDGKVRLENDNMEDTSNFHGFNLGEERLHSWSSFDDLTDVTNGLNKGGRPEIFSAFESYQFGNNKDGYEFTPISFDVEKDQHKEILRRHIALASGVMPTIYMEKDISLKELKELSKDGELLYRNFGPGSICKTNPLPTLDEIREVAKLNEYEKRLIRQKYVHPRQVMALKKSLETAACKGTVVTEAMYNDMMNGKSIQQVIGNRLNGLDTALVQKFTDEFQAQYHFTPQVVSEYIIGLSKIKGNSDFTDDEIKKAVKNFNRTSIGGLVHSYLGSNGKEVKVNIAQSRNPALIALSSKINFQEMPAQLIRALSVYVTNNNIHILEAKGFSKWIVSRKNDPVSDIVKAIGICDKVKTYNPAVSAVDTVNSVLLEKAMIARDNYERRYSYKFSDNEIAIKGRHLKVQQGNMSIYMLPADDLRNFIVGDANAGGTSCCQHFGGVGEACVWKCTEDPFAGNIIIEHNGEIVAQAFCWTDEFADTFVFDNFEYKDDGNANKYMNLIGTYVKHLPYSNVHIGMGYTKGSEWNGVGAPITAADVKDVLPAKMPTTLHERGVYSDYHTTGSGSSVARVLKKPQGRNKVPGLYKYKINEDLCKVTTAPDEPTKWDLLASKQFNFMLNDYSKPIEERLRLAERFNENPDAAIQFEVCRRNPQAILGLENPDPELQKEIYRTHPEIIEQLENPCMEVQVLMVEKDPNYLRRMENPPEELAMGVLARNGLLLEIINNPTPAMVMAAVEANGYAIRYAPAELQTEEVKLAAVRTSPKVASLMKDPSDAVMLEAVRNDASVILLLKTPSVASQMSAVRRQPDLILRMKNPAPQAVRVAVEQSPTMIRKFQFQYPELRIEAVRRNGFVIKDLKNVTVEEYNAAIAQNPSVSRFVQPPLEYQSSATLDNDMDGLEIE